MKFDSKNKHLETASTKKKDQTKMKFKKYK